MHKTDRITQLRTVDQAADAGSQVFGMLFEREDNPLPSSKINKTRLIAFYHKAYWRPALDGYHIGGALHYLGWKKKTKDGEDKFFESPIQTMKSDAEIEADPYKFSASHRYSIKTKLESRVTGHKQDKDTYISVGSFWGNATSRTIDFVREVDRIVIDIDGPDHRVLTAKEKKKISKEVQAVIGKADFVVDSGCGIQIHYLFERRQDIYAIQVAYNKIVDEMCKAAESAITLDGCSVDRLLMNSYYRLPGTYNTRSKSVAKVIEYNDLKRLAFENLALRFGIAAIQPYVKKEPVKREKTSSETGSEKRYKSYYAQLEHDYKLIAKACGTEGFRNCMIYYYSYNIQCAVKDSAVLQAKAEALNSLFSKPLAPSEIRETVQSAIREYEKHGRTFSFSSQLSKIGLSAADIGELDLWSPLTDDDRVERQKESKRKHNAKRKAQRHEEKQEVIDEVLQMSAEGLSKSEISRRTGLSRNTVIKYIAHSESTDSSEFEGCAKIDDTNTGRVGAEGACVLPDSIDLYSDEVYSISSYAFQVSSDVPFHQRRKVENAAAGKGFGYGLFNSKSAYANTISARYYKDGSEILIEQKGKNPRRLTPREAARLQGFPEEFVIPVSDTQAYRQFGNSVAVPVVHAIAEQIVKILDDSHKQ